MRLSSDPVCRLCRLMFCVTLLLIWLEPPQYWTAAAEAGRPAPAQRVIQAKNSLRALADAARKVRRDTFDVQAAVKEAGAEPAAIFEWVRDRTCWAPYRGALREDVGVLMDRVGNSLDRASLLAGMLKTAGQQVRLARAQLDARTAESLMPKLRRSPAPRPKPPTAPAGDNSVMAAARKYQIDEASVKSTLGKYSRQISQVREKLVKHVVQQFPVVSSGVGRPKADIAAREHEAALSALADHWWVQWQSNGQWVDLDPLLPDARPGQTVAAAQQTLDPAALTDDMRQQVIVRVVVEQWKDKKAQEAVVLEHAFRPGAVIGKEIHLVNYGMDWPGDFNYTDPVNIQARLKAAVLAQHEWVPMLIVGSEASMQASFSDGGEINPKPKLGSEAREGKSVAGAGQGVLGAFGGDSPAPASPAGAVTGEWIEYEIRVPGEAPRRSRREIFDVIGPAARAAGSLAQPALSDAQRLDRALALFGQTDILVGGCQLSTPYLTHLTLDALLSNQKLILALAGDDPAFNEPATAKAFVEQMKEMPGDLEELAAVRLKVGRYRAGTFIDRPNILTRHIRVRADQAGKLMGCRAFDIVANDIGVRPGFGANPFDVRLAQGVIDTDLESALLTGCGMLESAAETFASAGSDPKQWMTLKDPHDAALGKLPVSADVKTRIGADLAAGYAVIVPRAAQSEMISWWRIDPVTGTALGIGRNGWGPSMAEYAIFVASSVITSLVLCIMSYPTMFPNGSAADMRKFCLGVAVLTALIAVLACFAWEFLVAGGEGAGGGAAGGSGGGSPVDPLGKTLPGGPGGGGGAPPLPGGGGGGAPPLPGGGGGGGAPPLPGGGGGGAAGGGGGSPGGLGLENTIWDIDKGTLSGTNMDATLSEANNTLAGIGGLGGGL